MMAFEEFDPRTMLPKDRMVILMRINAAIALSRGVVLRWFSGKPYALLMFDPETRRVGLRPLAVKEEYCYPLKEMKSDWLMHGCLHPQEIMVIFSIVTRSNLNTVKPQL